MPDLPWILDKLPMGVWVARTPTGEVDYANDAFQEILGVPAIPGSPIGDAPATYGIFDRTGTSYHSSTRRKMGQRAGARYARFRLAT
jgi:hypothetical protein